MSPNLKTNPKELLDDRDAYASIRGFFYQLLITAEKWVNLPDNSELYLELGEDIATWESSGWQFDQVKHTGERITLHSENIQKFIIDSFRLWQKSQKTSRHTYITTSPITKERGSTLNIPWLSFLITKNFTPQAIKILKETKCKLRSSKDKSSWDLITKLNKNDLTEFLKALDLNANNPDYKAQQDLLRNHLQDKFPTQNTSNLLNNFVVTLLNKISESGIRKLSSSGINALMIKNVEPQAGVASLFNILLLESLEQLVADGEPVSAINAFERISDKFDSISDSELKFRIFRAVGRAYESLNDKPKAAEFYLNASNHSSSLEEKIYLEGISHLFKTSPEVARVKEAIALLTTQYPKGKRLSQLTLIADQIPDLQYFIKRLPPHLKTDPEVCVLIGRKFFLAEDFSEAIKWAGISANKKNAKFEHRASVVEYRLIQILKDIPITHHPIPNKETSKELMVIKGQLVALWEETKDKEIARSRAVILKWISNIEFLFRDKAYLATINEAIRISNKNPAILYMKAMYLVAQGASEEGLAFMKESRNDFVKIQIFELEATTLKSFPELSEYYFQFSSELVSSEEKQTAAIIYIRLIRMAYPEKLIDELVKVEGTLGSLYQELFRSIQIADMNERVSKLDDLALKGENSNDKLLVDLCITEFGLLGKEDKALELIKKLSKDSFFTSIDIDIIKITKRIKSKAELLNTLEEYISRFGDLPELLLEKINLDNEIGDTKAELTGLVEVIKYHPEELGLLLQRDRLLLEKGDVIDTQELIRIYEAKVWTVNHGINIVYLLVKTGQLNEALDFAYEIRRNYPMSMEANKIFVSIMFNYFRNGPKEWDEARIAMDQYEIAIGEVENKKYILEKDTPTEKLKEYELNQDHPLYSQIDNKIVGDEVQGIGRIITVRHKYVAVLQKILKDVETFIPDGSIKKLDVQVGDDLNFDNIVAMLRNQEESFTKTLNMYNAGKLPLSALVTRSGKSYFDVWGALVNDPDAKIKCANGDLQELQAVEAIKESIFNNPDTTVVLDISTILTLDWLGLKEAFSKLFSKVAIVPALVKYLKEQVEDEDLLEDESLRMGLEDGQLRSYSYNREFKQARKDRIEGIIKWLESTANQIPTRKTLELDDDKKERLMNFLGDFALDTMYLALERGFLFVSDDLVSRLLLKTEQKTESLWIQPILQLMLQKDLITLDSYFELTSKLVFAGYHYIAIESEHLKRQLKQDSYYISEKFDAHMRVIEGSSLNSAAVLLGDFFSWIYSEPILPQRRDAITIHVLKSTMKFSELKLILKLILDHVREKLYLNPLALGEFEKTFFLRINTQTLG